MEISPVHFNPFMPGGTKMYRQKAKNSNFYIFPFGHQMGLCAEHYKNLPSSLFLGINGLSTLNISWAEGSCTYYQ